MFEQLSNEKKSSNVMRQILKAIEEGQIKESDKLPSEPELAKEFGVSRSVVREAMSGLVAMGVVKRIAGRGTYVQPKGKSYVPMVADCASYWEHLQVSSSPDAYIARLVIEPAIGEYAAGRLGPRGMRQLKSIYKKMQQAIDKKDLNGYRELDIAFHLELAKASGNKVLYEILKKVVDLTQLDRWDIGKIWPSNNASIQRSLEDHKKLLELLERGTPREVRRRLEIHLRAAIWEYGNKKYLQGLGR